MKKIVLLALISIATFSGCKTTRNYEQIPVDENQTQFSTGFNEESYIWENLFFPKNKAEK